MIDFLSFIGLLSWLIKHRIKLTCCQKEGL